jgi:hypothetical protein
LEELTARAAFFVSAAVSLLTPLRASALSRIGLIPAHRLKRRKPREEE